MNKQEVVLVCKRVVFYELKDEEAFFEWIAKIKCVVKCEGEQANIYLHIKSNKISDANLRDLLALFFRYKINMKQLAVFLHDQNKSWFFDNVQMYWHKKLFGA
jgi:hypothetical protein